MDRLTSMAVFTRVVEAGSFTAAADAFGISAAMVGKHIRFLEDRLGTRLINRSTRRQNLSDFGRLYYERCKVVLAEAQAADALADDLLGVVRGRLHVTMPVLFGQRCVAPILLKLAQRHRELDLFLSFSDRPASLIDEGFDLAIRNGPLAPAAGVMGRRIASQQMVVCGAPAYLAAHGTPLSPAELEVHQAIVYTRSGRKRSWVFPDPGGPRTEIVPNSRLQLDDLQAIADAAVAGLGLAWLPVWLIREQLRSGTLVRLLADRHSLSFDCHALWLQTPHLAHRIRVAIDALAAELPAAAA